jgi:putative transposase
MGHSVVAMLRRLTASHGLPGAIFVDDGLVDNRTGFTLKAVARWAYEHGVKLEFSRPSKPTDNAFIESFNGRLREECLNQHWFTSLEDAKQTIEGWRRAYNRRCPHSSLGYLSPAEYLSNWTSTETRTKTSETACF